ncbi:MAG: 4Fe-4S binding protein, partial [Planctomycetales bacterium]|nr:4Fe-4S binding protein [Planctomycetales bacterium]
RPPGAIDEHSFLAGCTRCELCMEACPHQAIVHAPERLRAAAGTPMIDVDRQPCLMCADFPCIAACEPGVLTHQVPKMMGTARITEQLCLPYNGSPCTTCEERCPVEHAIEVHDEKPRVSENHCTGCGVCRAVCPAPENAILLMPTFLRPPPAHLIPAHPPHDNS